MSRMPTLFIGHGSPMNTLLDTEVTRTWRAIGESLPRPRAILMISAHWLSRGTALHMNVQPETIHDFGGFPAELFAFQYPAPGYPELYEPLAASLAPVPLLRDDQWGLDHGAWSILAHLFPKADIPVVQLSMDVGLDEAGHYALGQKLQQLREQQVLVIGSGNVVHNLSMMRTASGGPAYDWADRFNTHVRGALLERQHDRLIDLRAVAADARLSVPTPEHYWPLLYIAGASQADDTSTICVDDRSPGAISMLSWRSG